MDKLDENRNGLQLRFLKIYWPNIFFKVPFVVYNKWYNAWGTDLFDMRQWFWICKLFLCLRLVRKRMCNRIGNITALFKNTRTLKFKANWHLRFSLPSIILVDLSGNRTLLQRVQRSWFVICDCWISIRFVCFCVSRFVACDRNYDRRQRKTQLWRRLLSFRVRVFVKSAATKWTRQPWHSPVYVWLLWFWPVLYLVWLFLLFLFPGFG